MMIIGIIPSRYASTRLPGKPLIKIAGKTLIERVYRRAEMSDLKKIIVATDDNRIEEEVASFGGNVVLTGEHYSGTDRIAEAAEKELCDAVVNIQGDEPLISPDIINIIAGSLRDNPWADITTAASEIENTTEIDDPNVVKVVFDVNGRALYFSRSRIPFNKKSDNKPHIKYYKHIGIYGYRKEFLKKFISMKSSLETAESLEQLRALENGYSIHVSQVNYTGAAVDTIEDIAKVESMIRNSVNSVNPLIP
jgi:3-deoxy-manno-octulosonate cytidylyltransferase (CMP-KDO synthetase)